MIARTSYRNATSTGFGSRYRAVLPLMLAIATCQALAAGRLAAQAPFPPAQNPLAGAQTFGDEGCVECHSVNGLGGDVGPDLARTAERRSFYELAAAMWNHLPTMAAELENREIRPPRLDARAAGDLIAFLYTLDYFEPTGDVDRGRRLFAEKRCIVCHQVGGVGGVVGPNLDVHGRHGSPILVAAAMWNHGPAMAEAMRTRGVERPTFSGTELIDLIAYLRSVAPEPAEGPLYVLPGRPDRGRRLFVEKECIECHSVRGEGSRVGPDLAKRGRRSSLTEFAAAMWNKAPAMMRAMAARNIDVPRLSAEEMADLVAYLYSLDYFAESGVPSRGRRRARQKGCIACHALNGSGGLTAPDLARVRGLESPAAVLAALWNHHLLASTADGSRVAWPELSPSEMADISALLQAVSARE